MLPLTLLLRELRQLLVQHSRVVLSFHGSRRGAIRLLGLQLVGVVQVVQVRLSVLLLSQFRALGSRGSVRALELRFGLFSVRLGVGVELNFFDT